MIAEAPIWTRVLLGAAYAIGLVVIYLWARRWEHP